MDLKNSAFRRFKMLILLFLLCGCTPAVNTNPLSGVQPPSPFPPQTAMQKGDYSAFLAENEASIKSCQEPEQCAAAVFNLAFVHCYSKSPYYNLQKGTKYLEDLIKGAPETPWAYQARVWLDLIRKSYRADAKRRVSREEAKSRETQDSSRQTESSQETAEAANSGNIKEIEMTESDRQRLEQEIQERDAVIEDLRARIERARQIDIEIEKKERKLF